ncbi:hypothetical protein GCM10025734_40840 [Kitasatospora paranensis]|uniref:TetR/AcrR family transcriptional regulator n=1 Tax=Kitasatospora paranensis TaxID=258053 RepID=UPI0031E95A0B
MGNREDLLAGAKRCLYEKGYGRTTARDIASAAGVSLAAIGYHYGSKEALLTQATIQALGEWGTRSVRCWPASARRPTPRSASSRAGTAYWRASPSTRGCGPSSSR